MKAFWPELRLRRRMQAYATYADSTSILRLFSRLHTGMRRSTLMQPGWVHHTTRSVRDTTVPHDCLKIYSVIANPFIKSLADAFDRNCT
jgi:hypothetical protein